MRSKVGVWIGPPKVLDAPNPTSSVRIRRTFGAPLGASMPLGKSGFESFAVRPIFPLNGGAGLGRTSWAATGSPRPAARAWVRPMKRAALRRPLGAFWGGATVPSLEWQLRELWTGRPPLRTSQAQQPRCAVAVNADIPRSLSTG